MNRKLVSILALSMAALAGTAGAQGVFPQGAIVPLSLIANSKMCAKGALWVS